MLLPISELRLVVSKQFGYVLCALFMLLLPGLTPPWFVCDQWHTPTYTPYALTLLCQFSQRQTSKFSLSCCKHLTFKLKDNVLVQSVIQI